MKKFSEAAIRRFEDMMVVHLSRYFPNRCKAAGEPELRRAIRYGVKRAASYKIKAQPDVCRYIDLMMALGGDFDTDPKLPWASEILNAPTSQEQRISALLRTATQHLRRE